MMKHPRFQFLGDQYPHALEERFDRILTKIDELWDRAELQAYFSDLIIDKRGGRQGFPRQVLNEILMLRDLREAQTLRISHQKENALRELKQRGLPVTSQEFMRAVKSGDQSLVDLFVQGGVNVQAADSDGTPALIVAMKNGYSIIANLLIKAGADVNATDRMGVSPLLLACGKKTSGFRAVAEELIKRGAYINVRDPLGYTPLLLALSGGTVEVAALLIEHGAEINVRTRNGDSTLGLAQQGGENYLAELLMSKGAKLC
jgi:tankyrase